MLKEEDLRIMPWTSYPLPRRSSHRYEPSCPVIPVMNAFFIHQLYKVLVHIVHKFRVFRDAEQHLGYAPCSKPLRLRKRANQLVLVPRNQVKGLILLLKVLSKVMVRRECRSGAGTAAVLPLRLSWKVEVYACSLS